MRLENAAGLAKMESLWATLGFLLAVPFWRCDFALSTPVALLRLWLLLGTGAASMAASSSRFAAFSVCTGTSPNGDARPGEVDKRRSWSELRRATPGGTSKEGAMGGGKLLAGVTRSGGASELEDEDVPSLRASDLGSSLLPGFRCLRKVCSSSARRFRSLRAAFSPSSPERTAAASCCKDVIWSASPSRAAMSAWKLACFSLSSTWCLAASSAFCWRSRSKSSASTRRRRFFASAAPSRT
mmetsp:Transcript_43481/g.103617  ORF Transcript_43481/g.103617 Transcript_43481/m.103617 type:complete len:241 (-) Transcript_43481:571-1293(-)